jgi:signal transduction histidine kinase
MNLSKISRQEIKKEEVDLSALANDVVKDLRQSDPEREIEIVIMAGCKATGDPDLIKIALVNILGNAWKYTRKTEKPCIEFGCKKNDDNCIYFIKDNGTGFDMSIAADIFKPFKRLHKESEFAGTGIGLSIVEKVIQKHGGEIWAKSEPGKGATFFFTLTVQM